MQENLKRIIKILLTIFLFVIGIKFFIYLLPFIIVGILVFWLYIKIKEKKYVNNYDYNKASKAKTKVFEAKRTIEGEIVNEKIIRD